MRRGDVRGTAGAGTAALAALLLTGAAFAGPLEERVKEALPGLIEIRHDIHRHPELGFREHRTAGLVADDLRRSGLTAIRTGVAGTGVVAVLRGGRPGPAVAVRADMDALPVTETTDLPFRSQVRDTYQGQEVGVAHACGHDIHVTTLLGVARVLAGMGDELPGTVTFIFQPAEEGAPPGVEDAALQMVEAGILEDPPVAAIFGLHSAPDLEVGQVGYTHGAAMAAVDRFSARIIGKQAHGAAPESSVDPVVMAAQAVTALQTIRSRNLPPLQPSVVTVGLIRGGTRYNIIPGDVVMEGTVRTFDEGVRGEVERRMHEILGGITSAGGGSYQLDYVRVCPALVNDEALALQVLPALERAVGRENVIAKDPMMPGEDFAFFTEQVPGFYFHLGVRGPGTKTGGLHTPDMVADDGAVEVGMRAMTSAVLAVLSGAEEAR